jgi:hypothetical protein
MARQNKTYLKFQQVIKLIENEGLSLRKACERIKMGRDVFDSICDEDEKFEIQYTRAREKRADLIFEEILQIADSQGEDMGINPITGEEQINHNVIQRNRLQIDARKWMLGKMQPKKYSDKLDITTDGEKLPTPTTSNAITIEIVKPKEQDE